MAQDFSILLGVKVNTKTAQQQIDKIIKDSSKRKINLEVGLNTDKSLSNFNKQMAQIEQSLQTVTVKTREWTTAQGQLITQVEKMDSMGNTITQELNQQSDAYGNLTQKVTTYYKRAGEYNAQQISQTEQLITRQQALRNAYDNAINNYKNISTETNKYVNKLGEIVTRTTSVNEANQKTQTITKEYTDALGRLVTTSQEYIQVQGRFVPVGEGVVKVTNDEVAKAEELAKAQEKARKAVEAQANAHTSLFSKIADSTKKVAQFYVSTHIITAFVDSVQEAVKSIQEFDAALTEFKKVSDLSGKSLEDYTNKLGELGEAVARSRTQMLEAATEFKKSGFSNEQSAELAQIASLYQNVADSELSAADSASYIISQMKAFGMTTTQEAQSVIDKTNEVANNFAVSSTDISQALTKTSSAMAAYGNTIDESISLTTAGAEILNGNVGKVAKGLRSIGANITNLASGADEFQISVNGVSKSIQLIDKETGDMLSTYDVLEQISQYWDEMNSSEQSNLALTLANKTQFEVFTSVLSNFDTAEKALTKSLTSQGSAWKENEAFLQSNEASINSIKASFQELVLDSPLDEFVKLLLQATAKLMEFANSGLGRVILVATSTYAILHTLGVLWSEHATTVIPKLIQKMMSLEAAFTSVSLSEIITTASTEGLGAALALLNINPVVLAITALVAVVTALSVANSKAQQSFEEIDGEIESLKSESEQATQTIEELEKQLDEISDKKLSVTDPEELERLEAESAELENQLRLQYELIEANKERIKQDYEDKIGTNRNEYTHYRVTSDGTNKVAEVKQSQGEADLNTVLKEQSNNVNVLTTSLQGLIEKRNALNVTEAEYQNYLKTGNGIGSETVSTYERLNESISNVSNDLSLAKGEFSETVDYMKQAQEAGVELSESSQQIVDGYDEQIAKSEDATMTIDEIADKYGVGVDAINAYMESNKDCTSYSEAAIAVMAEQAEQNDTLAESLQNLSSDLTTLSTDYQSLKTAVDEYNSGGKMSLETLDTLINAATNYSGCLELQNGKLVLSEQYFENLAQQKIANAKADLVLETQERLANLAIEDQGTVVSETAGVIDTSKASVDNICTALQNMTGDAITAAQAWNVLKNEVSDDKKGIEYSKQVDKIRDEFTVQWKTLDDIGKQISGNFTNYAKSTGKAVSGASKGSAKESKDAWLEAYKAEKDALESLYKTNVITAEEYATKLRELSDKYLTDSADHQKKYAKEIHDAYEAMYTALKKSAKEALDEEEKRLKKVYDDTKDQKSKALKDLKKVHEEEEKAIKREIDALKKEKDAIKDGYDARIKALKSEREEYERQVKLMQLKEKLAKAKTTKQYVMDEMGRFTYKEDSEAVDQAREDLIEEKSKQAYERELNALEKARDDAVAIYEQRIQALEDHYDAVKERNDRAEEQLEAHYDAMLEQYERNYNDFKENADKYLNGQMQLVNAENTEWGRRLQNLANFVNEYNRLMNSLDNGSTSNSNNYSGASSKGASVSTSSSKSKSSKRSSSNTYKGVKSIGTATVKGKTIVKPNYSGTKSNTYKGVKSIGTATVKGKTIVKPNYSGTKKRASGDASISSDGIYLIGDSPNQELVIGSKLNGVPLTLSRGDGVVNAKSTRSLAGILNMIGGLAKPLPPNQTTNNSTSNITISNVSLPNIKNGEEFIDYLQHFDIDMMQRSYDNF